ncbi:FkbM family methyltransferase [Sanyastnella coralliicola]|uniref:FkbM family methyltransferase n=1 Tax=Sanyastnella coralliicola TaxID=3069118 RepID=UPI0027B8BA54|nr:FkbM family methyltransferase [Longitalea sp. SCSIO 12813]
MNDRIKQLAKKVLSSLGIHLTKNQRYDALALKVMQRSIKENSNCVDVGCHKGEILEEMIRLAPEGKHFAFEPIPELYKDLKTKFNGDVSIHQIALSDSPGQSNFHHVVSNPAYSGLKQRTYKGAESIQEIQVQKERLDSVLPEEMSIDFMKIDVEGAEFEVLNGAKNHIIHSKPTIIFEHGMGASDHYGTTPDMVYDLLVGDCGMKISLMDHYLDDGRALTREDFRQQFYESINYYFVAHDLEH